MKEQRFSDIALGTQPSIVQPWGVHNLVGQDLHARTVEKAAEGLRSERAGE